MFDGLPLGRAEVADAIEKLSPDRFRAVLDVLATIDRVAGRQGVGACSILNGCR